MGDAVAAFGAALGPLADDEAGAGEASFERRAHRIFDEVQSSGELALLDPVPKLDRRLEQPVGHRIDEIVAADDLHEAGRLRRRLDRPVLENTEMGQRIAKPALDQVEAATQLRELRLDYAIQPVESSAVAPGLVLGSVVIDLPHAFLLVAKEVAGGTFRGRVIPLGMRDDVVRWEPAEVLLTRLPPAFAARMDSTRLAMQAGRFPMPALTP